MHEISQLQFPPIEKLQALVEEKTSAPDLALFEFLEQLSLSWHDLGTMCRKWDELEREKEARHVKRSEKGDVSEYMQAMAFAMPSIIAQNRKRFYELAITWLRQNQKGYFQKLQNIAETISQFQVPEPETTTLSLALTTEWGEQKGQVVEHKIFIRSWPQREVFIAQQIGYFTESETLGYTPIHSSQNDLNDHVVEVRRVIWEARKEFAQYTGFWRAPYEAGYRYCEKWKFLGESLREKPLFRHPGTGVLTLFSFLAEKEARMSFLDMQEFLMNTPDEKGRSALFDWACEQDARVVL